MFLSLLFFSTTFFLLFLFFFFFFNHPATTEIYTLSLHDALPIWIGGILAPCPQVVVAARRQARQLRAGSIGALAHRGVQHRGDAIGIDRAARPHAGLIFRAGRRRESNR